MLFFALHRGLNLLPEPRSNRLDKYVPLQTFPANMVYACNINGFSIDSYHNDCTAYDEPIELKVMNCAGKLGFPDNSLDFLFSKDMFECISDKMFLVKEIYRVLKPGGTVICVNCDWDSIVYNGEKKLISKAIHAYAVTKQGWMDDLDSWIGRRMFGIFYCSGLFESSISVHSVVETE